MGSGAVKMWPIPSPFYSIALLASLNSLGGAAWLTGACSRRPRPARQTASLALKALSDKYLENDLVAVKPPEPSDSNPRLCVVRPDGTILPLCRHEDDVETDLFVDPRSVLSFWSELTDEDVKGIYGEGWYGQRPVPSLGGGPGYGAEADEIWSVDEEILEQVSSDGVDVPLLDVGISHGEKARGGAF